MPNCGLRQPTEDTQAVPRLGALTLVRALSFVAIISRDYLSVNPFSLIL